MQEMKVILAGLMLGVGRSPGGGHGKALQYSCLENPIDRGAWRATVHRVPTVRHSWSDLAHRHFPKIISNFLLRFNVLLKKIRKQKAKKIQLVVSILCLCSLKIILLLYTSMKFPPHTFYQILISFSLRIMLCSVAICVQKGRNWGLLNKCSFISSLKAAPIDRSFSDP